MADFFISVIVPVYGAEKYLEKCVNSIRSQTYDNMEIILVDDGSKDRSGDMCDEYARKDNRIKVIHKENGGLISAWMEGVRVAGGDYLSFVDSDDFVDSCMIEEMSKYLTGKNEIICCNHMIEHEDGRQTKCAHGAAPGIYEGDELEQKIFRNILGNENRTVAMSRCMKLTRAGLIRDNLGYLDKRIRMAEDVNAMLPVMLDAERIVVMKDSYYYHYYYNDKSMVHYYDKTMNENMKYLDAAIKKVMEDKFSDKELSAVMVEKEELFMFMLQMKNELKHKGGRVERVLDLIKEEDIKNRVKKCPLVVKDKGNQLLYLVMRKPNVVTASILTVAFSLKNRG